MRNEEHCLQKEIFISYHYTDTEIKTIISYSSKNIYIWITWQLCKSFV